MTLSNLAALLLQASAAISSESPRFDAEVLMAHVLDVDRSYLRIHPQTRLTKAQQQQFCRLVQQRANGWPIAYLTKHQPFWTLDLKVSPDVLIPRHDTETLVEAALDKAPIDCALKILDLGTGSGAIAISLALERPLAKVIAVDQSESAIKLATINAKLHQANHLELMTSNWFDAIYDHKNSFDIIVANPPYLAEDDVHLRQGDCRFEPIEALVAADHGYSDLDHIVIEAIHFLKPGGFLLVEHGMEQGPRVRQLFGQQAYQNILTRQDLGGRERVTLGQKKYIKLIN